jgi:DNA-binding response OmpR family regulator
MKVLIVEDQERLGQFLERGLKECTYTVSWVRTCKDALDTLAESSYDVVVLDLGLPDGDGIDILRQWRASGFNEPVLILSARDSVEDRLKGLDVGADDYLPKPFSFEGCSARALAGAPPILRETGGPGASRNPRRPAQSYRPGQQPAHRPHQP